MVNEGYGVPRFLPFGDTALLVEFGDTISSATNRKVVALSEAVQNTNVRGVEELVPTYRSLLIRYDPLRVSYEQLVFRVKDLAETLPSQVTGAVGREVVIPVVYGGQNGPDLAYVARFHKLSEEQVIRLHSEKEYRVYMIGFVAGFPYLGEVADEVATSRLETPRLKVPAGSVGIAENQTGIYPCEAPGGWQIIGRTPFRLFNPSCDPPALLKPGDLVKFKPISEKEYTSAMNQLLEASFGESDR